MDNTTHSVYQAANGGNTWEEWAGKTGNGGGCTGEKLGLVPHLECLNLDKTYSKRIRCVRLQPTVNSRLSIIVIFGGNGGKGRRRGDPSGAEGWGKSNDLLSA